MMLVECYKIQIAVKKFIRRGRGQLPFQLTPVLPQVFTQTTQNYPKNIGRLWKQAL